MIGTKFDYFPEYSDSVENNVFYDDRSTVAPQDLDEDDMVSNYNDTDCDDDDMDFFDEDIDSYEFGPPGVQRFDDMYRTNRDIPLNATGYHIRAGALADLEREIPAAIDLLKEGLNKYPDNIYMLADMIKLHSEIGETDTARKYYSRLWEKYPFKYWDENTFRICFRFLLEDGAFRNEKECRLLIKNYKEVHCYDEVPYLEESLLESKLGNAEDSIYALSNAVKLPKAPECALQLMERKFKMGLFEEIPPIYSYLKYAAVGVTCFNFTYAEYIYISAAVAMLLKKSISDKVFQDEVERLKAKCISLLKISELKYYTRLIKQMISYLNDLDAVSSDISSEV